ncbi:Arc family DNA-binding protein [Halomonas denitrificans]|uniref:Arc family DNA-binding protein n=1 Tax=Halomonas denitrificans TaxID=370769 RepID=UPI001CD6E2F1|nr:Arc family DNA-binding protein [Halomonas denitrificans]MCA0973402.1 Arc family DNA-binding protein [Halomonas denitrificans]
MTRADPQFKLRVPSDLKERIEKSAAENHRSMNAEIVARLSESFRGAPGGEQEGDPTLFGAWERLERLRLELDQAMSDYKKLMLSRGEEDA